MYEMGACVWFTGLSGAGKSTTAAALRAELCQRGYVAVVIDGDELRGHQTRELGFSAEDRHANAKMAARIARDVIDDGSVAIVSLITPYRKSRTMARRVVGVQRFIEVFVDTPLSVCEQRDTKGLYRRVREGEPIPLTGVTDRYEPPVSPEITLDTVVSTVEDNVTRIVAVLDARCDAGLRLGTRSIAAWSRS
jgi:sulfate adenylyltransferase